MLRAPSVTKCNIHVYGGLSSQNKVLSRNVFRVSCKNRVFHANEFQKLIAGPKSKGYVTPFIYIASGIPRHSSKDLVVFPNFIKKKYIF